MAYNTPPSPEFPTFFLFFGNIHRDVRCEEGWLADPRQQDKTYIPGKNEALCCRPDVSKLSGLGEVWLMLACRPNMKEICQDHVRRSVEFVSLLLEFATGCRFFGGKK